MLKGTIELIYDLGDDDDDLEVSPPKIKSPPTIKSLDLLLRDCDHEVELIDPPKAASMSNILPQKPQSQTITPTTTTGLTVHLDFESKKCKGGDYFISINVKNKSQQAESFPSEFCCDFFNMTLKHENSFIEKLDYGKKSKYFDRKNLQLQTLQPDDVIIYKFKLGDVFQLSKCNSHAIMKLTIQMYGINRSIKKVLKSNLTERFFIHTKNDDDEKCVKTNENKTTKSLSVDIHEMSDMLRFKKRSSGAGKF